MDLPFLRYTLSTSACGNIALNASFVYLKICDLVKTISGNLGLVKTPPRKSFI